MTDLEAFGYTQIGMVYVVKAAYDAPPPGWLKCDRRLVLIADYPDLKRAIGAFCHQKLWFHLPGLSPESDPADKLAAGDWVVRATL